MLYSYRCLVHHFGTLPSVISLPIVSSEAQRQTAQTRERFKFLAHLPLGVPFELVDIDVAAVCGPNTLGLYFFISSILSSVAMFCTFSL
jgi:hypothetical protein